jgi:hypothetical protein
MLAQPKFQVSNSLEYRLPRPKDLHRKKGVKEESMSLRSSFDLSIQNQAVGLAAPIAELVSDYVGDSIKPFGKADWKEHYKIDVGIEPNPLLQEFRQFWYGPDPIDAAKRVYETHFPPVLRPRWITHLPTNTFACYNLYSIDRYITRLRSCPSSSLKVGLINAPVDKAIEANQKVKIGPSCWLVLRKEAVGKGLKYPDQVQFIKELNIKTTNQYEEEPSAIDLMTVVATMDKMKHSIGNVMSRCQERTEDYEFGDYRTPRQHLIILGGLGKTIGSDDSPKSRFPLALIRRF